MSEQNTPVNDEPLLAARKAVEGVTPDTDLEAVLRLLMPLKPSDRKVLLKAIAKKKGATAEDVLAEFNALMPKPDSKGGRGAAPQPSGPSVPKLEDAIRHKDFLAVCVYALALKTKQVFSSEPLTSADIEKAAAEHGLVHEFERDKLWAPHVLATKLVMHSAAQDTGTCIWPNYDGALFETYYYKVAGDTCQADRKVCTPFILDADGDRQEGKGWALRVRVRTSRNTFEDVVIYQEDLVKGGAWQKKLQDAGMKVPLPSELLLMLQLSRAPRTLHIIERCGWIGEDIYVLPNGEVLVSEGGSRQHIVMFEPAVGYEPSGSFEQANHEVFRLCEGNSRLELAACAGLAGPFLGDLGEPGGGFHFYGATSSGKTLAARVAASASGSGADPLKGGTVGTWRATDNGIEVMAAQHSDGLFVRDEMHQCKPEAVQQVIYMLGNGKGKETMNRNREARKALTFRNMVLSTGELSSKDHIEKKGGQYHDGAQSRLCDIPADAGKDWGIFEKLHEFEHPAQLAKYLEQATAAHYGQHVRKLVERYLADRQSVVNWLRGKKDEIHAQLAKDENFSPSDPEARAAHRFALCGAVGEWAIREGVLPWTAGSAQRGVQRCFKDWLEARGRGNLGALNGLAKLENFLVMHRNRFIEVATAKDGPQVHNVLGFRRGVRTSDGEHWATEFIMSKQTAMEACGQPQHMEPVLQHLKAGRHERLRLVAKHGLQTDTPTGTLPNKRCYMIQVIEARAAGAECFKKVVPPYRKYVRRKGKGRAPSPSSNVVPMERVAA